MLEMLVLLMLSINDNDVEAVKLITSELTTEEFIVATHAFTSDTLDSWNRLLN